MKNFTVILAMVMLLTILAGCGEQAPAKTDAPTAPETTQSTTPETTEAPTEAPTVAPTEETTDIDPMNLVGSWQRTHTEVEGDRNENTKASITIAGDDSGSLTLSFTDQESPDFNIKEAALDIQAGELFVNCGNDIWYAEATGNSNTYDLTLVDNNTLLLLLTFDFDGYPMVSSQWFSRSE